MRSHFLYRSIPAAVISMGESCAVQDATVHENNLCRPCVSGGHAFVDYFGLAGVIMIGWWTAFPFWDLVPNLAHFWRHSGCDVSIPLRRALVTSSDLAVSIRRRLR